MVIYILDALQHREAALIAVWVCLGLMNMSFGLTALFFSDTRSIMTPILTSVMNGITLFLTGEHTLLDQLLNTDPKSILQVCLVHSWPMQTLCMQAAMDLCMTQR